MQLSLSSPATDIFPTSGLTSGGLGAPEGTDSEAAISLPLGGFAEILAFAGVPTPTPAPAAAPAGATLAGGVVPALVTSPSLLPIDGVQAAVVPPAEVAAPAMPALAPRPMSFSPEANSTGPVRGETPTGSKKVGGAKTPAADGPKKARAVTDTDTDADTDTGAITDTLALLMAQTTPTPVAVTTPAKGGLADSPDDLEGTVESVEVGRETLGRVATALPRFMAQGAIRDLRQSIVAAPLAARSAKADAVSAPLPDSVAGVEGEGTFTLAATTDAETVQANAVPVGTATDPRGGLFVTADGQNTGGQPAGAGEEQQTPSNQTGDQDADNGLESGTAPSSTGETKPAETSQPQPSASFAGRMEKFAASTEELAGAPAARAETETKSSLESVAKRLTGFRQGLGIATAKPDATMSSRPNIADPAAVSNAAASFELRADASIPQPVVLTSSAHRAVEAVLDVTERFTAHDRNSVNLQFTVGGRDLNVRVEMRGGEVHTTFRTDSDELRSALSAEWQNVTAHQQGDRSVRLAAPVFASNSDSSSMSFGGDGASRQRDQQPQAPTPSFLNFSLPSLAATSTSATVASTATRAVSVSTNSVHLHTLA